ncbi:unnamed protein product, partial [marine sediment metagenome]
IGYSSTWGGEQTRFLSHRSKILKQAQGLPVEWVIPQEVIPEAPAGANVDNILQ